MMKRAVKQIAAAALLLLVFCVLCRVLIFNEYTIEMPVDGAERHDFQTTEMDYHVEKPEVFDLKEGRIDDNVMRVTVQPNGRGDSFMDIRTPDGKTETHYLSVGAFNTVYDHNTGGFTGDSAVLIAVTVFFLAISAIMILNFRRAKGSEFYSYVTIYFAGFSIFSTVTGILLGYVTVMHLVRPYTYSMFEALSIIRGASTQFMMVTSPLVLIFSAAMFVSNIALIRHEGYSPKNALGIALAIVLLAGDALGAYLFAQNLSGSYRTIRFIETLQNTYATIYVYFECMLAGSAICAVRATRMQPEYDKDFIIILGCRTRRDGTPTPLLRGRADRALSFWKKQKRAFSREAIFIPSGGQGADENTSEAEAVEHYLVSQGVHPALIHAENKSTSTYENMLFSRRLIEELQPQASAVFATTNYHLFRSGVTARRAGLPIEGIGSKTRWWYWPNAFVRECASLLVNRWKEELVLLICIIAFFSLLAVLIG